MEYFTNNIYIETNYVPPTFSARMYGVVHIQCHIGSW